MSVTHVHVVVHSGTTQVTNSLSGTPVAQAGPKGLVRVAYGSSKAENRVTLRATGQAAIIDNSGPHHQAAADTIKLNRADFVFVKRVTGGSDLDLQLDPSAASEDVLLIETE